MSFHERLGLRVVEQYRQTDFPEMYIDMQPVVERMQPEESLEDLEGGWGGRGVETRMNFSPARVII